MRRSTMLCLFLALVLGPLLAWWLGRGEGASPAFLPMERSAASRVRVPAARLQGTVEAAAPGAERVVSHGVAVAPVPPGRVLRGVVVDPDGAPVVGARVFLLSKASVRSGEAENGDPPHTSTDADGAWTLGKEDSAGRWIGAVAEGFLPAHLDGDAVQSGGALRLVLERGPVIGIRIEGVDGLALALDTSIWVDPTGDASAWPAPGAAWAFRQEATIPAGSQTLRLAVGTTHEVVVAARYRHTWWLVSPQYRAVVPTVDDVVFTISRSCQVDLHVLDAETGDPLSRGFEYKMLEPDGKAVSGGLTILPGGQLHLQTDVRVGVYVFRVWATGYRPKESLPLTLTTPGERGTVEVALERDPTRGNLRISVPILPQLPRRMTGRGGTYTAPAFFYWKRSTGLAARREVIWGDPGAWGGLDGEKRRENDTDYLFEGVPEGEVALWVGEVVSGRVAYVPRITIRGGHTDTTTVDLWPGIFVDPADLIPAEGTCRSFRVRHPMYGDMPAFNYILGVSNFYSPGKVPSRALRIGPYPGPEIEVEVVTEDGEVTTRTYRVPAR